MPLATINHIDVDDRGVARIVDSRIRVMDLVMQRNCNGWTPEEVHDNFPHLSLAKIYAAFAYYHDHRAEVDAQIEEYDRVVDEYEAKAPPNPFIERLRREGKIP